MRGTLSAKWRRAKRWRSTPFPIAQSLVVAECVSIALRSAASLSARDALGSWNARHMAAESMVADLMVSVRPCLKAAVLALS